MKRAAETRAGFISAMYIVFFAFFLSACSLSGGQDRPQEASTAAEAELEKAEEDTGADQAETVQEPDELEIIRSRVDKIREKAEAEAPEADRARLNEAANYIKDHYDNCYDKAGSMEHMIYYGYLLFYRFGDGTTLGDMGHSGATAAKLVYRQEETANSPTVQAYKEDVEACIRELKEED